MRMIELSALAVAACLLALPAVAQDQPAGAPAMKSERAMSGGAMKPEAGGTTSQRAVSGGVAKPTSTGGTSERALPPGK